jgi:hypothetical protein
VLLLGWHGLDGIHKLLVRVIPATNMKNIIVTTDLIATRTHVGLQRPTKNTRIGAKVPLHCAKNRNQK